VDLSVQGAEQAVGNPRRRVNCGEVNDEETGIPHARAGCAHWTEQPCALLRQSCGRPQHSPRSIGTASPHPYNSDYISCRITRTIAKELGPSPLDLHPMRVFCSNAETLRTAVQGIIILREG